ncbi:MAG: hypothetical protein ACJ8BW_32240 [Ktedonobacteraceae bacterium]
MYIITDEGEEGSGGWRMVDIRVPGEQNCSHRSRAFGFQPTKW